MSVDNITLALLSLKLELETHLINEGWKNDFNMFLASDPILKNQELVLKKTKRNQIELPVIYIDPGTVRTVVERMGDEFGMDVVSVTVFISCKDMLQLLTLANLLRRKINDFVFNILDFRKTKAVLGTAEARNAEYIDLSNPNSNNVAEQFYGMINANLELNAEALT